MEQRCLSFLLYEIILRSKHGGTEDTEKYE